MEMDFSFVNDEIYNLKDIPRKFEEDLYVRLGVSPTVINYWRSIEYVPPYYYQFWVFYQNRGEFSFNEYRRMRDALIFGVCKENDKIGNALKSFAENEDVVYDSFIKNDGKYMYFLSEIYDDQSEDTLMASVYYDNIINGMKQEIDDNKGSSLKVGYSIIKYPMLISENQNQITGLDIENHCGQFWFDQEGIHRSMSCMKDFPYEGMDALYLLEPYIFVPHPFKTGDIVKFDYYGEDLYGVLYYAADTDGRTDERSFLPHDGSDFSTTIITVFYSRELGGYESGHNHICPLFLDKAHEDDTGEDLRYLLLETSKKMKEDKDAVFSWLPSYLDKYNENI